MYLKFDLQLTKIFPIRQTEYFSVTHSINEIMDYDSKLKFCVCKVLYICIQEGSYVVIYFVRKKKLSSVSPKLLFNRILIHRLLCFTSNLKSNVNKSIKKNN